MNDKILLITGNAGQGKTTIAANIATALSLYYPKILLIDSDMITPKLSYHFGIMRPKQTIQQVMLNGTSLKEALYAHPTGLEILFSGSGTGKNHPSTALKDLEMTNTLTIVDVPFYDLKWYKTAHPTILVTEPDFPSIIELTKLIRHIPNVKGIIINKASNDINEMSAGNIQQFTGNKILGVIPFEQKMKEALKNGYPLVDWEPEARTSRIIKEIAANLINPQYKTPT